jgi:hypothetical protein
MQVCVTGSFECQLEVNCMSWAGETVLKLEPEERGGHPPLWQFLDNAHEQ